MFTIGVSTNFFVETKDVRNVNFKNDTLRLKSYVFVLCPLF